jgi:hypothetical protein
MVAATTAEGAVSMPLMFQPAGVSATSDKWASQKPSTALLEGERGAGKALHQPGSAGTTAIDSDQCKKPPSDSKYLSI